MDRALNIYREQHKFPHPPRPLTALSEDNQIALLRWRSYYIRFGYPLNDILFHGLRRLVSSNLRNKMLSRHGDLLGIGVPLNIFLSDRVLDELEGALVPVPLDGVGIRRLAASRFKVLTSPDVYDNLKKNRSSLQAKVARLDRQAMDAEKRLKVLDIVIDPFVVR